MKAFYIGALPGVILLVAAWFFDTGLDRKALRFFAQNPHMLSYAIAFIAVVLVMIIITARLVLWDRSLE